MESVHRFSAILKADILERVRSTRFWIVLGLTAALTWWYFPPASASYLGGSINGEYRGLYSSAWIGMMVAVLMSSWFSLGGFYLVRGTLARDIETQVWQLLVATPMTRATYLLAKWTSHLLVFALIVFTCLLIGALLQLVRAEDLRFDLLELVKPVLLLSLPSLALTAMLAIWFDMLRWLRRTAGNVLFFVLWTTMFGVSMANLAPQDDAHSQDRSFSDAGGIVVLLRALDRQVAPQFSEKLPHGFCASCGAHGKPPRLFQWPSWQVRSSDLPARAFWLALALFGVLLAAPWLDRAAANTGRSAGARAGSLGNLEGRRLVWLARLLAPLQSTASGILLAAELQLVLRQRKLWWWLALLALCALQVTAPINLVALAVIGGWLLSLDLFAGSVLRERDSGTGALIFTAAGAGHRIVLARALMLVLCAWAATLPALLRCAVQAPAMALAILVLGITIPLWGLALGALTRSPRPFEVIACILAYAARDGIAINVGIAPLATVSWHLVLLPLPLLALGWSWPRLRTA